MSVDSATIDTLFNRKRSLIAVIGSMVVVNLVYGVTLPLLSLILDAKGISKTVIGLSIVAQASGGVLLVPVMSRLIVRFGAARVMQFATLLAAVALLALGLIQNVALWFPLRFLLGASAAILWAASETAINELTDDQWRGRIIGIYASAGAAGFALGPLVLLITGSSGLLPFVVTAAFIAAASLPLIGMKNTAGSEHADSNTGNWQLFKLVPHIMLLNLVYAAAVEAYIAFFPLFGLHIGLSEARSLSLLTTFAVGGVVLQLPLGWLADHMNRHRLLLLCVVITMIGFALLPSVIANNIGGPLFAFTLGGIEGMIYALGVILLGQQFRGPELAGATVLFTGMWGIGTMLGPMIIGIGMDSLGDSSMSYLIAAIYAIYLPILLFYVRSSLRP